MLILDTALKKRAQEGKPVKVAMCGAGYIARGIAMQMVRSVPGLRLVAISNRTLAKAQLAFTETGAPSVRKVDTAEELQEAISRGEYAITDDPRLLCDADDIDVLIEATGEVEFGAEVVVRALQRGKHVVLMSAELDATVGPILKVHADRAGVVISNTDGDQPGEVMNLMRFVRAVGCRPVLAGNIKGMIDHYRTPDTQRGFAEKYRQQINKITSYADGTKIAMEMAVVANATGFPVAKRGMIGPACAHANDAVGLFPTEQLLTTGLTDYILGAEPGPGVFVIGHDDHPARQEYMDYFKMGKGPFYVFYTPYHLPHRTAPLTAARAALFHDASIAPLGVPVCEVIALAKRPLRRGGVLDGIGGFDCYGVIENVDVARRDRLLPMGLARACMLVRDLAQDQPITYADVVVPSGRFVDRLREEQDAFFATAKPPPTPR